MAVVDPKTVGADRAYKTVIDAHKSTAGVYRDAAEGLSGSAQLALPAAPDPAPFVIRQPATGGREDG